MTPDEIAKIPFRAILNCKPCPKAGDFQEGRVVEASASGKFVKIRWHVGESGIWYPAEEYTVVEILA